MHNKENPAQVFKSHFRTDVDFLSGEPRWVGIENEYLMVSSDGMPISRETLENFWRELADQGWTLSKDQTLGTVVAAVKKREDLLGKREYSHDVIATEVGYSTLEIALAPTQTLKEAHLQLYKVLTLVTSILRKYHAYLLGYGVQPLALPKREYLGASSRYEIVCDIWEGEYTFGQEHLSHCLSAASQTQVEVSATEAIPIVNALNATSGLRIALLANSSIWQNKVSGYKAIRQLFWDGFCPHRKLQIGIPPRFQNVEHYIDYIFDFRAIMIKRGETLYRLNNNVAFRHFFWDECGQEGITLDGQKAIVLSDVKDIDTQCGFAWFDTRLQPAYGTIEDRVSCQQPPHEHLCASALTLGLVENHKDLISIADRLSTDQWREIRLLACSHGLAFSYPGLDLNDILQQIIDIADEGLRMRALDEEVYLEPLYKRLAEHLCPADEVQSQFLKGGIAQIIAAHDMRNAL